MCMSGQCTAAYVVLIGLTGQLIKLSLCHSNESLSVCQQWFKVCFLQPFIVKVGKGILHIK